MSLFDIVFGIHLKRNINLESIGVAGKVIYSDIEHIAFSKAKNFIILL